MKALRARTFGGDGAGAREGIGFAASRLAKSLVDKINGWDAARDGKLGQSRVGRRGRKERNNRTNLCTRVRLDTLKQTTNSRRRTACNDGQVMTQVIPLPGGDKRRRRRRT